MEGRERAVYRVVVTIGPTDNEFAVLRWVVVQVINAIKTTSLPVRVHIERVTD